MIDPRSIRVNKTHARNMSNLGVGVYHHGQGSSAKGTQHTVKRVGKGFDLGAESCRHRLIRR